MGLALCRDHHAIAMGRTIYCRLDRGGPIYFDPKTKWRRIGSAATRQIGRDYAVSSQGILPEPGHTKCTFHSQQVSYYSAFYNLGESNYYDLTSGLCICRLETTGLT